MAIIVLSTTYFSQYQLSRSVHFRLLIRPYCVVITPESMREKHIKPIYWIWRVKVFFLPFLHPFFFSFDTTFDTVQRRAWKPHWIMSRKSSLDIGILVYIIARWFYLRSKRIWRFRSFNIYSEGNAGIFQATKKSNNA